VSYLSVLGTAKAEWVSHL